MIKTLRIENLVVVKKATLNFEPGLTVVTGETGAGKSVLLSAFKLLAGARSDVNMIRPGSDEALIEATFTLDGCLDAISWLNNQGFATQSVCTIQRRVSHAGRAKITINGESSTQQQLKVLTPLLFQLHGQHQHQQLTSPHEQRRLLDAYADNRSLRDTVQAAYQTWLKHVELKELLHSQTRSAEELALLRYQFQELEDFAPQPQEWQSLSDAQHRLSNVEQLQHGVQSGLLLLQNEQHEGIIDQLHLLQQTIRPLNDPQLDSLLTEATIQLTEILHHLQPLGDGLEADPSALAEVEARLSAWYQLARKHHVEPENLVEHMDTLRNSLEAMTDRESRLTAIDADIEAAEKAYWLATEPLSRSREQATVPLEKAISAMMNELGMPGSEFVIQLSHHEGKPSPHGAEAIQFVVRTNPDHPRQPLAKVASGGELSRMSLSIQAITAHALARQTLLFDEVDVGVSGKTGAMVGQVLKQLAEQSQLICITHLPQVASCADAHILVEKHIEKKKSHSTVNVLSSEQRIEEIARLIGGLEITEEAREHAKALLEH